MNTNAICLAALAFLAACDDRPYMTQDCVEQTSNLLIAPIMSGNTMTMVLLPTTTCSRYGPAYCYDPASGKTVNAALCERKQ